MDLTVEKQNPIRVYYEGQVVGDFFADLVAEGKVILELKAVEAVVKAFEAKLINYLKASEFEVGLLINFGPRFSFKRRIYSKPRLSDSR